MTATERTGSRPSEMSAWVRGLPAPLDSSQFAFSDLDWVWHNWQHHWLITLEFKTRGGELGFAQAQLLGHIEKMLTKGSGASGVEYRGHYVVVFDGTCPTDSTLVEINRYRFSDPVRACKNLLATGRIPLRQWREEGSTLAEIDTPEFEAAWAAAERRP